jgi:hypothetical protein
MGGLVILWTATLLGGTIGSTDDNGCVSKRSSLNINSAIRNPQRKRRQRRTHCFLPFYLLGPCFSFQYPPACNSHSLELCRRKHGLLSSS